MSSDWKPLEKGVARAQYDKALAAAQREYLERFRNCTAKNLDELWQLELEIRKWRKEFSDIFHYTYSHLELLFSICLRRGWLTRENLSGLSEARLERILKLSQN